VDECKGETVYFNDPRMENRKLVETPSAGQMPLPAAEAFAPQPT
jgi:hypothetical protein